MSVQKMNYKILRRKVAEGETEKVIKQLLAHTEVNASPEQHQEVVLLSNDFETYEKEERSGVLSHEQLRQRRNQITAALLSLLETLKEAEEAAAAASSKGKSKGMTEAQLKRWIGILLAIGKLFLFAWVIFTWQTGGFTKGEAFATLGFLLPIFAAYLSVMLNEYVKHRHDTIKSDQRVVSKTLVWITFILIPLYIWAFYSGIGWRARGVFKFEEMNTWLTLVESGLGIYVGTIVFELFKKGKEG